MSPSSGQESYSFPQSLLSQGYKVKAYDVYAPSLEAAVKAGAEPCATPAEAADVDILGLMVVNAAQVEDALFGSGQVAAGMSL
jgi:3-hydroxyisobutyrate dehydrogenase-like beta-hydroxyacid dehydrogenase